MVVVNEGEFVTVFAGRPGRWTQSRIPLDAGAELAVAALGERVFCAWFTPDGIVIEELVLP